MFIRACQAPDPLSNSPTLSPTAQAAMFYAILLCPSLATANRTQGLTIQRLKIPRPASNPFWPDTKK